MAGQDAAGGRVIVSLSRPIKAHGEEISTLSLREPTGKDLRLSGEVSTDGKWIAAMISALAEIPISSVDQLAARDWVAASKVVGDFLSAEVPARS